MKTDVTVYTFRDTILRLRPNNFSYKGLTALYEYLEEYEDSCDTEIEFDPIALCCEFSEDTIEYFLNYYDLENIEELENNTMVIYVDEIEDYRNPDPKTTIIIQDY